MTIDLGPVSNAARPSSLVRTVATPLTPLPNPLTDTGNAEAPCVHCGRMVYRCHMGLGPAHRHSDTERGICR